MSGMWRNLNGIIGEKNNMETEGDVGSVNRDGPNGAIVEIAWREDFDDHSTYKATGATIVGRCTYCWGRLVGRRDEDKKRTSIECRLCGRSVEGEDAMSEMERMRCEAVANLPNVCWGLAAEYREDAKFVLKILPDMVRNKAHVDERIAAKIAAGCRKGWLSRHDFPFGTVGHLYLQAGTFLAGIESLPREQSVIPYSDLDFEEPRISDVKVADDGSTHVSGKIAYRFRQPPELLKGMGLRMMLGMTSAFACELVLKAILITRIDEARKTHDLLKLYNDLPEDSRTRLKADFAEIEDVLEQGRHTFEKWRYFETNVGEEAIKPMVNYPRALALAKAARVIVDEGKIAGLDGEVEVKVAGNAERAGGDESYQESVNLEVTGWEAPIPWDLLLETGWGKRS